MAAAHRLPSSKWRHEVWGQGLWQTAPQSKQPARNQNAEAVSTLTMPQTKAAIICQARLQQKLCRPTIHVVLPEVFPVVSGRADLQGCRSPWVTDQGCFEWLWSPSVSPPLHAPYRDAAPGSLLPGHWWLARQLLKSSTLRRCLLCHALQHGY